MGKPKGKSAESQGKSTDEQPDSSQIDEIWSKLEAKLNAWVVNTLPALVKELIKPHVIAAVDEYVSSSEFTQALSDSLKFDIGENEEKIKAAEEVITKLQTTNSELLDQVDDLEQYTRRTNLRIYGIPETSTGSNPEDTDSLVVDLLATEFGAISRHTRSVVPCWELGTSILCNPIITVDCSRTAS